MCCPPCLYIDAFTSICGKVAADIFKHLVHVDVDFYWVSHPLKYQPLSGVRLSETNLSSVLREMKHQLRCMCVKW